MLRLGSALTRSALGALGARRTIMATTPDLAALRANITALNEHIHTLKSQSADPATIAAENKKLGELKKQLGQLGGAAKADSKKDRLALKTPKGTRDWSPLEMSIREHIFSTLQRVFKAHGGVTIDTPVFELRDILTGKYGEDSKLIYDLQDQGGELCSLRYDLTVPFARFLAMNGTTYPTIKRYHIAKVYRRDAPAMTKGRMREFYQCDFDIAGLYDPMVPDAETLCILSEALTALDIKDFTIKINHRKILDGIFGLCGVPVDKTRSISSAVDKLDKLPWADVKKEMVEEKGLPEDVADKIGEYVKLKGGPELLTQLRESPLASNESAKAGMDDMDLLFKYLNVFGITHQTSFDLSLARGLDYYTGLIYEAVVEGSAPPAASNTSALPSTKPPPKPKKSKPKSENNNDDDEEIDESQVGVGSIAAGGRYDDLVGMFASAAAGKSSGVGKIPCVGVSVGVERVFSILMQREKERGRSKATEVFVASVGEGLIEERMKLAKELWDAGIKAEYMYKVTPRLDAQFKVMDKELIPYAVMLGPDEIKEGKVKLKIQYSAGGEDAGSQVTISREELIPWLKQRLGN
ncbi:histidyl-tRNA synthetase [Rhizoctonia solani AG-1 IB]|uniref:histidine--tRNA ligase n=1 Tax=Thanatephorus cucumeris (strain AG1-IB / isolate 7/3/14) TaxID=1108050 RepID=A0A0B7FR50_THACB|nr:histidyl-tRNA synthetase [Rhizoctonia solani AG-1 IB]